jgi:valyl-tRNA synthetase
VRFEGLTIAEAREQIVKDLAILGLLEKTEDYEHNVGRCDRCGSVIEPLPSEQWFLKMDELAQQALRALKEGQIRFYPARWAGPYEKWLNAIRDWNISRQLWWGQPIPVEGETDVFDTWFSSALWPFAVLGWPKKSGDFKNYYPTDFITSAREILYLWITRMIFSGMELTGRAPFRDIFIHPLVMTKDGRRMSKSLGTGIDPVELIEKYGTDALRFGLAYQTTGIQDMRFNEDVIMMGKKFANKLWNIARYVIGRCGDEARELPDTPHGVYDPTITKKMDACALSVTRNIEQYNFGEAAHILYDFVWHDFADKYIEETKDKDDAVTKMTLMHLLVNSLKLLHPFMPFVTEEIYSKLPFKNKNLLLVEDWPIEEA